jgi:hypothetical protein
MADNPFKKRDEARNKILSGKDEARKKEEITELDKMYAMEDMKERFDYAAKILAEHGGLESSIEINHPYWKIRP